MDIAQLMEAGDDIRVDPEDSLAAALSVLHSSHDSACVVDGDEFLGVISPYYASIRKTYPAHTKVKHALTHPPKLSPEDQIGHAARLMIESKIHTLPVLDGGHLQGVVTAQSILAKGLGRHAHMTVNSILRNKPKPHTILDSETLVHAHAIFKSKKISKLIVVDSLGKLTGILSYSDIIEHLAHPKDKNKPVTLFHKMYVVTASGDQHLGDVVRTMNSNMVGSVIVIDRARKPVGIITTSDLLSLLAETKPAPQALLRSIRLSPLNKRIAEGFAKGFNALLRRKSPSHRATVIERAEIAVEEKGGGSAFEAAVSLFRTDGKRWIFKKEDRDLNAVLQTVQHNAKRFMDGRR